MWGGFFHHLRRWMTTNTSFKASMIHLENDGCRKFAKNPYPHWQLLEAGSLMSGIFTEANRKWGVIYVFRKIIPLHVLCQFKNLLWRFLFHKLFGAMTRCTLSSRPTFIDNRLTLAQYVQLEAWAVSGAQSICYNDGQNAKKLDTSIVSMWCLWGLYKLVGKI